MSIRSDWGEGSSLAKEEIKEDDTISMSFEAARPNIDRSMSLNKKSLGIELELLVRMN